MMMNDDDDDAQAAPVFTQAVWLKMINVEVFIGLVKVHQECWNTSIPQYHNRELNSRGWGQIQRRLKDSGEGQPHGKYICMCVCPFIERDD